VYRYRTQRSDDHEIRERLKALAGKWRRFGCARLHVLLRRGGVLINHKKTERLYREERLTLRKRRRKKYAAEQRGMDIPRPTKPNHVWSMDFVMDGISGSRRFKTLSVIDEYTRWCHKSEVDTSLTGERVKRTLNEIAEAHGLPEIIIVDNGPEFISRALDEWAYHRSIKLFFIRPGKPVENCYIESFNGRFRDECLNQHWFRTIDHARQVIEQWRQEYNTERPHSSLGYLTPAEYIQQILAAPSKDNSSGENALTKTTSSI
jgi:putative transposase